MEEVGGGGEGGSVGRDGGGETRGLRLWRVWGGGRLGVLLGM